MDCRRNDQTVRVVGGDDLTIKAVFYYPDNPTAQVFAEGDRIDLLVHADKTYSVSGEIVGKAGYFTLSGDLTQEIAESDCPFITYSIRILWADGGRTTPICRAEMEILSAE